MAIAKYSGAGLEGVVLPRRTLLEAHGACPKRGQFQLKNSLPGNRTCLITREA